jgi:hypothetical protein
LTASAAHEFFGIVANSAGAFHCNVLSSTCAATCKFNYLVRHSLLRSVEARPSIKAAIEDFAWHIQA